MVIISHVIICFYSNLKPDLKAILGISWIYDSSFQRHCLKEAGVEDQKLIPEKNILGSCRNRLVQEWHPKKSRQIPSFSTY